MTTRKEEIRSLGNAKAHFAECVRAVEKGQAIVLTRHGRPVAQLVPFEQEKGHAEWARGAGRLHAAGELRERLLEYEELPVASPRKMEARRAVLERLLEREIWPQIPQELIGKGPTRHEREQILGIGEDGT